MSKPHANRPAAIASGKHTFIMLGIVIFISVYGLVSNLSAAETSSAPSPVTLYLSLTIAEWALLYYVWIGIRKVKATNLVRLISRKDSLDVRFGDFLKGVVFWVLANVVLYGVKYLLNLPFVSNSNDSYLPHNALEYAAFFILALSAGFCEEVIYRGYFQRQFSAKLGNKWIGIILQGLLFGVSHGYQGIKYVIVISVYGILFGLLVNYVNNLKPAIIAHAWQDIFSGIIYQGT